MLRTGASALPELYNSGDLELYNPCVWVIATVVSRAAEISRISSSEARANLATLLERVGDGGERVLIERRGKTPVALVSVDDFLRFQLLEELQSRSSEGRR